MEAVHDKVAEHIKVKDIIIMSLYNCLLVTVKKLKCNIAYTSIIIIIANDCMHKDIDNASIGI